MKASKAAPVVRPSAARGAAIPRSGVAAAARVSATSEEGGAPPTPEGREAIERSAYFRAQARGFEPGHELEDWLAAETEIAASVLTRRTSADPERCT